MLMTSVTPAPIRILVVDDHALMREGLRVLIEAKGKMRVVGDAANRSQALELAALEQPDLILLDLDLGDESGLDFLQELLHTGENVRVLVFSGARDPEMQRRAMRLGAMGVLAKDKTSEVLIKAIRKVCAGEVWLERSMTASLLEQIRKTNESPADGDFEAGKIASLTKREREIISLVAEGLGTKPLAGRLFISEKTVRNHMASIYGKLEVSDRLELAIYAGRHGLIR
jgi:DNA-binding NarL/FixJ family response regulator